MNKGLEALKETAIQIVEALYGKEEPLRNNKINELLETKQFKCIEKELKAFEIIKDICDLKVYKNKLRQCFLEGTNILFTISQEKYDLLKEAGL